MCGLYFNKRGRKIPFQLMPSPIISIILHDATYTTSLPHQTTSSAGKKKFGDETCFPYCHLQVSQVTEFDLGVKWVKVNPDSSFEQITMGHSSQCYIHSFNAIIRQVPEKKVFLKIIYHIWSWRPWSCDWDQLNKISFLPTHKSFIWNLTSIFPAVFNEY